ncbi:Hypothetical predicted protein [Marmota monax]|uniref:Uncharacterized protein n=1 Tax=Marmota monax TaxID=9995 RepID=A0A5E4B6D8_MARMO|nr:Hypothetical predicted protein [Marmota monax]
MRKVLDSQAMTSIPGKKTKGKFTHSQARPKAGLPSRDQEDQEKRRQDQQPWQNQGHAENRCLPNRGKVCKEENKEEETPCPLPFPRLVSLLKSRK